MKNFITFCENAMQITLLVVFLVVACAALFLLAGEPIEGTWADTLVGFVTLKISALVLIGVDYFIFKIMARYCD